MFIPILTILIGIGFPLFLLARLRKSSAQTLTPEIS